MDTISYIILHKVLYNQLITYRIHVAKVNFKKNLKLFDELCVPKLFGNLRIIMKVFYFWD